ncbi:type IV pilin protein [Pseudoalteromonas phenolica]
MMKSNHIKGFTLLEMLIVVAIAGILASVAYPQYTEYVIRAARSDAMVLLLDAANKQEQYYADNRSYAGDLSLINIPSTSENGYFNITVEVPDAGTSFTLTATAAAGAVAGDTACTTFTITDTGIKGSTGTSEPDDCWER